MKLLAILFVAVLLVGCAKVPCGWVRLGLGPITLDLCGTPKGDDAEEATP